MVTEQQFLQDLSEMLGGEALLMETDLLDVEEWDSFSKVDFLALAEERYGAILPKFDVAVAESVRDLYNLTQNALAEKRGDA